MRRHALVSNVTARVGALISLALATLLVARVGGPTAVGVYALLRVLPGIVGLVFSSGLPGAAPFFLARPEEPDGRLRGTLVGLAVTTGIAGTLVWGASSPLIGRVFFEDLPVAVVALAGLTVLTQLLFATSKACLQGLDDMPGTNWAILLEEFIFLPGYLLLYGCGLDANLAIVIGLLIADAVPTAISCVRLARRSFFEALRRPTMSLARTVCAFGARGQVGNLLSLLNFRLDFVLLGALTGPGVVGSYAIASKFAELLRLPSLSLFWVLYPRFAKDRAAEAVARARWFLPRAGLLTLCGALPLAALAEFVIPELYGTAFQPAVVPAQILLLGLSLEGISGVIMAFLYGQGRPGLNSLVTGGGLIVTIVLDLLLIPRYGATGAAWASTAAYLSTACMLVISFQLVSTGRGRRRRREPMVVEAAGPVE